MSVGADRVTSNAAAVVDGTADHRPETLYGLAEAEYRLGLLDQAARHFGQALGIVDPSMQGYLYGRLAVGLGRIYLGRGEVEAATVCAQRAEQVWSGVRSGHVGVPAPLAGLPSTGHPGTATVPGSGRLLEILSRREHQIAVLVSEGCTNQRIATALTLSPKTVETYLARIFRKLAITSRSQIAHLIGRTG